MNKSLLPPSVSNFMRSAEAGTQRVTNIPVDLRKLWTPDECPLALLPYLAWALSVDRWDKNWSEQVKRQVIKSAWVIHRQKATIAALYRAVEPLGYVIKVTEWWEVDDPPGTFRMDIGVLESGISEEMYFELERLIADAKPTSRHLIGLNIIQDVPGSLYTGCLTYDGSIITIYPE